MTTALIALGVLAIIVTGVLVIGRLPSPEPRLPIDSDLADMDRTTVGRAIAPSRPGPASPDPVVIALIALGGAIGGPARYEVAQLLPRDPTSWPWSTLAVNLTGAAVLGFVLVILTDRGRTGDRLRALIGTGACGAFTTFSTFGVETTQLLRNGAALMAGAYVSASVIGGLAAVYGGMVLGRLGRRADDGAG